MRRFKVNISRAQLQKLKLEYPEYSAKLDDLVEYAGPKAFIHMDKLPLCLPLYLTDELWKLALRWINRKNFSSYFIQLREMVSLPFSKCRTILEIGPGIGVFRSMVRNLPYELTTVDVNYDNKPDIVCDITCNPIKPKSFDIVVAFQVLEHLPYREFQSTITMLGSVARNYVFISIPYRNHYITMRLGSSLVTRFTRKAEDDELTLSLLVNRRFDDINEEEIMRRKDKYNPHYWEAGQRSFPIERILSDIESSGLTTLKKFHNPDFPYHYFILLRVR